MNLVFGVLFLWLGSACLWVANQGTSGSTTGWGGIWSTILDGIRDKGMAL